MTKTRIIVLSLLLIGASVLILVLGEDSKTNIDEGLVSFFSGILMGAGLLTLLNELLRRKKRVTTDVKTENPED
jgi:hypothetical protein